MMGLKCSIHLFLHNEVVCPLKYIEIELNPLKPAANL